MVMGFFRVGIVLALDRHPRTEVSPLVFGSAPKLPVLGSGGDLGLSLSRPHL